MKIAYSFFALAIMLTAASSIYAKELPTGALEGSWIGEISMISSGDKIGCRIDITLTGKGYSIEQFFQNQDGSFSKVITSASFLQEKGQNLVYVWQNDSEIWSESQVFSISYISPSVLDLVWVRHVVSDKNGIGDPWFLSGSAILRKLDKTLDANPK